MQELLRCYSSSPNINAENLKLNLEVIRGEAEGESSSSLQDRIQHEGKRIDFL